MMGECKTQEKLPFRSRPKPETTMRQQAKSHNPVRSTEKNTVQRARKGLDTAHVTGDEGTEAEPAGGTIFTAARWQFSLL